MRSISLCSPWFFSVASVLNSEKLNTEATENYRGAQRVLAMEKMDATHYRGNFRRRLAVARTQFENAKSAANYDGTLARDCGILWLAIPDIFALT